MGNPRQSEYYDVTLLVASAVTGPAKSWPGGPAVWFVYGTFGGATATLQLSPDNGTTWLDTNAVATSPGGQQIPIPSTALVRLAISGGVGTSISSKLSGV